MSVIVAMALAEMKHHTAPNGTEDGQRREGEKRDAVYGGDLGNPPPQPELFSLFEEEPVGGPASTSA